MKNLGSVFLGVSKANQRKFYLSVLKAVKDKYPQIQIPCAGAFTLVDVALEAGYKPSDIHCSDISVYSSLLGYLFTGKPLDGLKFSLSEEYDTEYKELKTDTRKAAYLIWLMKSLQINTEIFYENIVYEYLTKTKEQIIDEVEKKLISKLNKYQGIRYEIRDLRSCVMHPSPDTISIVHSPAYAKGYAKQFDFEPVIFWHEKFEEFAFSKEFATCYLATRAKPSEFWIWSAYNDTTGIPKEDQFFAEEVGKNKFEFFCVTRPEAIKNLPIAYQIQYKNKKPVKPLAIKVLPKDYEITKDTKIGVMVIQGEHALYYRDLWAHKMGTTKAEIYYLFTLDDMAFGVTGIHLSDVLRLKSTDIMEVFGFDQPLDKHPNAHKLFMMLLTSMEFKRVIESRIKVNRIHEMKGFKTTCITKYRKLKSSTGLLKIIKREKMPNGLYKLLYHTPLYRRNFQETLELWLKDFDKQDLRKNQDDHDDDNEGEVENARDGATG